MEVVSTSHLIYFISFLLSPRLSSLYRISLSLSAVRLNSSSFRVHVQLRSQVSEWKGPSFPTEIEEKESNVEMLAAGSWNWMESEVAWLSWMDEFSENWIDTFPLSFSLSLSCYYVSHRISRAERESFHSYQRNEALLLLLEY